MPVGFERGERVADVLSRARIALGPFAVDPVEQMQNAPTDRRNHAFHGADRTRGGVYQCRASDPRIASLTAPHAVCP